MYRITVTSHKEQAHAALIKAKNVALSSLGKVALEKAKAIVPVDTGRLRDSLSYSPGEGAVIIGSDVPYGSHVELGARGRPGAHFLRDALALNKEAYGDVIRAAMKGGEKT